MRLALPWLWCMACWLALGQSASAQTWSLSRVRPSLFEIIAVDAIVEPGWPWGLEDLAQDGTNVSAEERGVDIRSVYADARERRLWLRAYFSSRDAASISKTALTLFFVDADERSDTGGPAHDEALWPALGPDPSTGGYELVAGVRADGELSGLYRWNAGKAQWVQVPNPSDLVAGERGVARDPLLLLYNDHAYAQVTIDLAEAALDERCLANIFVRNLDAPSGKDVWGDDVDSLAMTCRPRLNRFGDPALLKTDRCSSDDTCPGGGRCRDGICVFGYECAVDAACRTDQRCSSGVCVWVATRSCQSSEDCDGLVCAANQCSLCADSGSRACAAGELCAPDGRCLSPVDSYSGDPDGSDDSGAAASGERVQGGAFSCSTTLRERALPCVWLTLLPLAWRYRRRLTRRSRSERGGEP